MKTILELLTQVFDLTEAIQWDQKHAHLTDEQKRSLISQEFGIK